MKLPEFMHTSAYKEQQALEAAMRQQNRERRAIEKQQEKQQYEQEMASLKKTVDELHKIETMRAETAKPLHKELVARSNMDPVSPMFGQGLYGTPEISPLQTTPRPLSRINPLQQAGIQYPASPMSMYDLYNVAKASDVLGKVLNAFKRDLFRRGIVWKPLFSKRCKNCKTEYETPVDSCEVCQAQEIPRTGDFEKPDPRQKAKFSKFLRLANESGQTLKHILRQLEDDINITDNGWLIIRKEYLTVAQPKEEASEEESFSMMNLQKEQVDAFAAKLGKVSFKEIHKALYDYAINGVLWSETRELIRGDPLRMRIVGNARGMLGGHFWVCLSGGTRIPLLDGSEKTLKELHESGRKNIWVYGCDADGNIVPARVDFSALNKRNTDVLAVTLDNGEVVKCTPDHEFMLRDGSYRQASELVQGDSLMPLYRRMSRMPGTSGTYEEVLSPATNEWNYTHRIVGWHGKTQERGKIIHHSDINSLNNDPSNLMILGAGEHIGYHRKLWIEQAKKNNALYQIRGPTEKQKKYYEKNRMRLASISAARTDEEKKVIFAKVWETRRKSGESRASVAARLRNLELARAAKARSHPTNHKVISVACAGTEDVYDLVNSTTSNFAISAGVFVHNCLDHRTRPEDKYRGLQAAEARWSYGEGAGIIRSFVRLYEEPGKCQEANCGKDLHEVYSAATDGGTAVQEAYVAGEVIHIKRFDPTLTYGYTPLGHCWKDVTTRLRMKQYLNEYFRYFRYPRGVLVAMTDNPESFYRFWDAQMDRLRYDSWHIPALAIEKRDGKGFFDFVKFSGTFEELQYGDNIADTEKAVFEVYGVMRAAADSNMGVTGDYIRLTPGAMMWHQESYEEFLFPRLLEQFHITDWNLEILPTEEDDEMELINIRLKKIEEAERMLAVGMKVRYTATKDFEFSGQPKSQEELMGGGGQMPGMFGQEDFGGGGEEGGGEESPETGEDEDTGEDEESQIDSLIQDMLGGESTKDRGREQRGGGVAKAKQKK